MGAEPLIAATPDPPYWAVIFTSVRAGDDDPLYTRTAERMMELAVGRPGFLGVESAREAVGLTVSYWRDLEAIAGWKADAEHLGAQALGRNRFYSAFKTRIARVERDYGFERGEP